MSYFFSRKPGVSTTFTQEQVVNPLDKDLTVLDTMQAVREDPSPSLKYAQALLFSVKKVTNARMWGEPESSIENTF